MILTCVDGVYVCSSLHYLVHCCALRAVFDSCVVVVFYDSHTQQQREWMLEAYRNVITSHVETKAMSRHLTVIEMVMGMQTIKINKKIGTIIKTPELEHNLTRSIRNHAPVSNLIENIQKHFKWYHWAIQSQPVVIAALCCLLGCNVRWLFIVGYLFTSIGTIKNDLIR